MWTLDAIRYAIAWLLLVTGPGAVLFWFPVHPFVRFWRRIGYRWGYVAGLAVYLVSVVLGIIFAPPLLSIDFGLHAVPLVGGLCLLAAHAYLRRRWRTQLTLRTLFGVPELAPSDRPPVLLTEGIYARIRHPRYLETLLGYAGYACLSNYLAAYGVAAFLLVGILVLIPLEERELADRFGPPYEEYRRRVPALIPSLSRDRRPEERPT